MCKLGSYTELVTVSYRGLFFPQFPPSFLRFFNCFNCFKPFFRYACINAISLETFSLLPLPSLNFFSSLISRLRSFFNSCFKYLVFSFRLRLSALRNSSAICINCLIFIGITPGGEAFRYIVFILDSFTCCYGFCCFLLIQHKAFFYFMSCFISGFKQSFANN